MQLELVSLNNMKKKRNRKMEKSKKALTSVYPSPVAVAILGGYRSSWLNRAIECWAHLLGKATDENADLFGEAEWRQLADAFVATNPKLEARSPNPGEALAGILEDAARLGLRLFDRAHLARKLAGLDYLHAWAVIFAVQWALDTGSMCEADEWWTVAFRGQHAQAAE